MTLQPPQALSAEAVLRQARRGGRAAKGRAQPDNAERLRNGRAMPPYRPRGRIFRVDRSAFWFREAAWFRVSDIPLQTVITGATGSGKTSCVVQKIVRRGTRFGVPFVIYCAKQEDGADFRRFIEAGGGFSVSVTAQTDSSGRPPFVFPVLRYLEDLHVATLDIVEVIAAAMSALDGGQIGKSAEHSFWDKSMRVVLGRTITLLRASRFDFSLPHLMRAMGGLPIKGTDPEFFAELKASAILEAPTEAVEAAIRYFEEEFQTLDPKTSGAIRAMWSAMAAELEQPPLSQLLTDPTGKQLAVTPSTILDDRIPVILDVPTLVHPRSGAIFQALFRQCFKVALHQRKPGRHVVGVVQDEFQASVPSRRELTDIMTTARSKNVGGIYATQAVSEVSAVYGSEGAKAIFGTPNLLIACRNDDEATRTLVSGRAGDHYVQQKSWTSGGGDGTSVTRRQEKRPVIEPAEVSALRRPRPWQIRPLAEAIVLRNGGAHFVYFDRLSPGPMRVLRTLLSAVLFERMGSRDLARRFVQAVALTVATAILSVGGFLAATIIEPKLAQDFETWAHRTVARRRAARAADRASRAMRIHVVRLGETLGGIADRYQVSVAEIATINNLRSVDAIDVGQTLRIPPDRRSDGGRRSSFHKKEDNNE